MPDTFSWERARTDNVGVAPHGAHVRRRTGIIRKPVSSRAIRWAPSRRSFFYLRPLPLTPLADPTVVAFFGARLGTLRAEATGAQQSADVVGMVDDIKPGADHLDDPSTGPQTRAIARGFRPGHDHASQLAALGRGQLGRAAGGWPCPESRPTSPAIGPFPPPDGSPIHAEPIGHRMHGNITLKQFDGTEAAPLKFCRTPLWAHTHLPQRSIGHYLCRCH